MKAIVIHRFGDPKDLKVEEVAVPEVRGDEVLVAIRGAAINPSDVKNVGGKMHGTTLPRIPGRDFAGVVVRGPAEMVGQEVWGTGGEISRTRDGTHAEFIALPREAVVRKPGTLSFEAAAAAGLAFITAWEALVTMAALSAGETAVIFGATGSVGAAAVQLAKARGARVIGVVRSENDVVAVRQDGADEVLNSRARNIAEAIRAATGGRGAEVVFDSSGMMFAEAIESAAGDARVPIVAAPPDGMVTFNLRTLYRKMLRVGGIDTLRLDAATCAKRLGEMVGSFESGKLKAKEAQVMPLSKAAEAYERAARGGARIVLNPGS